MIIIDKQPNETLMQVLKTLPDMDGIYCVHFKTAGVNVSTLREHIIASAQPDFVNARAYCCDDGDVFLLDTQASGEAYKKIMLKVGSLLEQSTDIFATLYDLSVETGSLLILLEQKLEQNRKNEEKRQKQEKLEQTARKRQDILELPKAQNVSARRKGRDTAEIMIIEDDAFSRRLVENTLQKQYKLTGLATADEALSTYADLAPNVLLLDINLPDVTGHELLEKIMALDPEAYVVMLSGSASKDNITQAMERGAKGFVAKPFSREKLLQYIERCPTVQ